MTVNSHADEIIATETERFAQSNFTSMVPPTSGWLNPPETPIVRVSTTITVNLERGQVGEGYTWTREEAILIRDALIAELGHGDQVKKTSLTLNQNVRRLEDCRVPGPTMGPDYRNGNLQG